MDVPEVEDADAALTWEALQSVSSDDHADHTDVSHALSGANTGEVGGVLRGALDADDHEPFPPLDELPSFAVPASKSTRSKRKNVSKHLQFVCLERYAVHARANGKLPDKASCQLLLLESFAQFVREGGSAAHPRLVHTEFLKLVRNRSAERQRRMRPSPTTISRIAVDGSSSDGRHRGKKRKHADEYEAKIDTLIEEIDRVRRPIAMDVAVNGTADSPNAVLDAILRLQHDTQRIQRELQERLGRLQDQCDQHEPASASV